MSTRKQATSTFLAFLMLLECKAAVALNNMAVTMMERSCYDQAYATLRDAAAATKLLLESASSGNNAQSIETQISVKIEQANHRAAKPDACTQKVPVHGLWDDTDFCKERSDFALQRFGSSKIYFDIGGITTNENFTGGYTMIRIGEEHLERDFALATCCILFNLSVATIVQAQIANSTTLAVKLKHGGVAILLVCQDLLEAQFRENVKDPIVIHHTFNISWLVFRQLTRSLVICGRNEEANRVMSAFAELFQIARKLDCNISRSLFEDARDFAAAA